MALARALAVAVAVSAVLYPLSTRAADDRCRLLAAGKAHEKAGRLDEALVHYYQSADNDGCEAARPEFARLAKRFAAEAEKQGRLYGEASVFRRVDDAKCAQCICDGEGCQIPVWCAALPYVCVGEGRLAVDPTASAFAWFQEARDYPEADRVVTKLARSKPQDLATFTLAHGYLSGARSRGDAPSAKPELLREVEGIAAKNGDGFLAEEEKASAEMLRPDAVPVPARSLQKLERAREWLAFVPGGEAKVAGRAVQRGDKLATSEAPAWLEGAVQFYEFAHAEGKLQALRARVKQFGDVAAKAGEPGAARRYYEIAGADAQAAEMDKLSQQKQERAPVVKEKDDAAKAKFKEGQESLEKELGL
ncbi:MAG: hypothetical protein IH608_05615 [Proteobacteria bacterium]|nr:hypothetical protein [Pseudomonadota bacterium]